MNTLLKLVSIFNICLLLFPRDISAQSSTPSRFYGIDLTKTMFFNSVLDVNGFVLEPVFLYKPDSSKWTKKIIGGYSVVRANNQIRNSNILTKGFYLKGSMGIPSERSLQMFLGLFVTYYSISNTFRLTGNHFDDYEESYTHRNLFALGPEMYIDVFNDISIFQRKYFFLLSFRLSFILINTRPDNYPIYDIPGIGIISTRESAPPTGSDDVNEGTDLFSAGVNFSIFFNN